MADGAVGTRLSAPEPRGPVRFSVGELEGPCQARYARKIRANSDALMARRSQTNTELDNPQDRSWYRCTPA